MIEPKKAKHCVKCGKVIRHYNKSGYCHNCYMFKPDILAKRKEYDRIYSRQWRLRHKK